MKFPQIVLIINIFLISILSCSKESGDAINIFSPVARQTDSMKSKKSYNVDEYNNTKGYWENGEIITSFDCPDSRFFPPINIKAWDKIPVVNGRLPTYEETMNGTSIHHYGEKENGFVKPYYMTLPKLAYHVNRHKPTEFEIKHKIGTLTSATDLVVVIQIVQTPKDTIVGFRYLTGGCGGSVIRDFRFLTGDEVKIVSHQ